jgi:hypothetical protein
MNTLSPNKERYKENKMYQVFENNKPADITGWPMLRKYDRRYREFASSKFNTFIAAYNYMMKWLGEEYRSTCIHIKLNTPVDASGYEDYIEIRKVK